tara:strand:+ start:213 stop:830 length:618 start_codon:yes stop_codon:yes gene_type:complete
MENYLKLSGETGNWKQSFNELDEKEMIEMFEGICITTKDERKKEFQMSKIRKMFCEGFKRQSGGCYLLMRTLMYYAYLLWRVESNTDKFSAWRDKAIDYARTKQVWDTMEWDNEALRDQLDGKNTVSQNDYDEMEQSKDQEIYKLKDELRIQNKNYSQLKELFRELEEKQKYDVDKATQAKMDYQQKEIKRLKALEDHQLYLANK